MDNDILDKACNTVLINFYSLGKNTKQIELSGFDPNNQNHLGLFELAVVAHKTFNYALIIQMPFLDYLQFKFKYRKHTKMSWRAHSSEMIPSCNQLIYDLDTAYNSVNILKEIYNIYYKEN